MSGRDYDYFVKLLIIGDSSVGKSCLLLRFTENEFTGNFIMTVGIDFKMKTIAVGNTRVRLQIWDTAGQERFRTITSAYYRGAQGILLVYDVSNRKSFKRVERWMRQIRARANEEVCTLLIAQKCDLREDHEDLNNDGEGGVSTGSSGGGIVQEAEGRALAERFGMEYVETSARTNYGVDSAFRRIAELVLQRKGILMVKEEEEEGEDRQLRGRRGEEKGWERRARKGGAGDGAGTKEIAGIGTRGEGGTGGRNLTAEHDLVYLNERVRREEEENTCLC